MFKEATIQGKISGPVMIVSVTQKQTRTSKPYLILKLRDDQKKEVDAKLWNMSVEEFPFDKNTVIIGEFSVGEYNGQKDFTLDMYREALESEYRMEDFINAAPYSPQKMYEYILQIADQTVLDDDYLAIIHNIYEKYKEQIFIWSAAKAVHSIWIFVSYIPYGSEWNCTWKGVWASLKSQFIVNRHYLT